MIATPVRIRCEPIVLMSAAVTLVLVAFVFGMRIYLNHEEKRPRLIRLATRTLLVILAAASLTYPWFGNHTVRQTYVTQTYFANIPGPTGILTCVEGPMGGCYDVAFAEQTVGTVEPGMYVTVTFVDGRLARVGPARPRDK